MDSPPEVARRLKVLVQLLTEVEVEATACAYHIEREEMGEDVVVLDNLIKTLREFAGWAENRRKTIVHP